MRLLKEVPEVEKKIASVEHKSKRETEVLLKTISPESARPDSERVINAHETEIQFTASERLMQKLQRIRELSAHSDPNPSYAEMIEKMADLMLEKLEKDERPTKVIRTPSPERQEKRSRYIPAPIRRAVWKRDGGKCTYHDPKTGRRCSSRFRVQVDHRHAFACNGEHSLENLRLLCRTPNTLHAIRCFGGRKMRKFLKG